MKGFTLLEVIIYLALFAMLMAGALTASFDLVESGGRDATNAQLAEEGNFVLAKVRWVLDGSTVTAPTVGSIGSILSVQKVEGYDGAGNPMVVPITLDPATLESGRISISSVTFYHAESTGTGINPESVGVRFALSARSSTGVVISQTFFGTSSIQK